MVPIFLINLGWPIWELIRSLGLMGDGVTLNIYTRMSGLTSMLSLTLYDIWYSTHGLQMLNQVQLQSG